MRSANDGVNRLISSPLRGRHTTSDERSLAHLPQAKSAGELKMGKEKRHTRLRADWRTDLVVVVIVVEKDPGPAREYDA
jgi:hypothetical protein